MINSADDDEVLIATSTSTGPATAGDRWDLPAQPARAIASANKAILIICVLLATRCIRVSLENKGGLQWEVLRARPDALRSSSKSKARKATGTRLELRTAFVVAYLIVDKVEEINAAVQTQT